MYRLRSALLQVCIVWMPNDCMCLQHSYLLRLSFEALAYGAVLAALLFLTVADETSSMRGNI